MERDSLLVNAGAETGPRAPSVMFNVVVGSTVATAPLLVTKL